MSKDVLKKVTSCIRTPDNVPFGKVDEPKVIFVQHSDHVEICGQRISNIHDFGDFVEYLYQRVQIEKDYAALYNERSEFIEYIIMKLEESKLLSTYEQGVRYPCIQERIYQDILNRIR